MTKETELLQLTTKLVCVYVTNNAIDAESLPEMISSVFVTLRDLDQEPLSVAAPTPAVPIEQSVFPKHLVCLEDGKPFKSLTRHLRAAHGMTPAAYRQRWSLPPEYPMTAPADVRLRAARTTAAWLGRRPAEQDKSQDKSTAPVVQKIPEGVRGVRRARRGAQSG